MGLGAAGRWALGGPTKHAHPPHHHLTCTGIHIHPLVPLLSSPSLSRHPPPSPRSWIARKLAGKHTPLRSTRHRHRPLVPSVDHHVASRRELPWCVHSPTHHPRPPPSLALPRTPSHSPPTSFCSFITRNARAPPHRTPPSFPQPLAILLHPAPFPRPPHHPIAHRPRPPITHPAPSRPPFPPSPPH